MMHSHLTVKSYAHFRSPQFTGDLGSLSSVQSKSTQIIKGLESKAYGQRWKELGTSLIPQGKAFQCSLSHTLGTASTIFWVIWILRQSPSVSPRRKMRRTWKQSSDMGWALLWKLASCLCFHRVWSQYGRQKSMQERLFSLHYDQLVSIRHDFPSLTN